MPEEQINQEKTPPRVSAIVVSHNRAPLLHRCLEALGKSEAHESIQVIVVDNGSTDGSAHMESDFPDVRFMRLPRNFGLTKALNIGIRSAEAEYLFFLHEDTEVFPDTVPALVAALDSQPDAGAAAPRLVDDQGRSVPQVSALPPSGVWQPIGGAGESVSVDYATGAALMVRSFFIRAMRKFDERYGQFGSDAEICFQIRRVGKKVLVLPSARAVHHGRPETTELRDTDFQLGVATFIAKHYGIYAGVKTRFGLALRALGGFRLRQFAYLISGQKLDGTQS